MAVKLGHAKFQPSSGRGTFSNWGLSGEGVENSMAIFALCEMLSQTSIKSRTVRRN